MAALKEKIGYGFGDMSSSMFWKIFSYYLPIFYSNIYGLSLADTGVLLLVTRIWDAVSDPMMGVIADRTQTRWGKYRPYLLWISLPFAVCGVLLFTTPDFGATGKLVWAYITYMLMMTVYTAINVPYGAMLGVMTDDSDTKTVFSSYRMFFAYGGSFIALFAWEPLCAWFKEMTGSLTVSWQYSMIVIAAFCFVIFLLCFSMTREYIKSISTVSIGKDIKSLLANVPWWLLIGAALCSNLFSTVRGATAAYFFKDYIGDGIFLSLGDFSLLFYAGLFLSVGEVSNMIGVVLAVPLSRSLGKKSTYISTMAALAVLSIFVLLPALYAIRFLVDAGYASRHICLHRYCISVGMEYVCGCFRLCRTKRRNGFNRTHFLFFIYGAEVWRCVWGGCRYVDSGCIRLQYGRGSSTNRRSLDRTEFADELDTGCRGRFGYDSRILLSVDKETCCRG